MADYTTDINITPEDRARAAQQLAALVTAKVANADVSKGSAIYDLVIESMASVYAFILKEIENLRARQSLLLVDSVEGIDTDAAVDEILSNWFVFRRRGRKARGSISIYATTKADIVVPTDVAFVRSGSLTFYPDYKTTHVISEDELVEVVDDTGTVVAYVGSLGVVAETEGDEYNIEAGSFVSYSGFSPYVLRVVNETKFSGGDSVEDTAALLKRAQTAVSERSLNSARSIDAVLKDNFADIEEVIVIGAENPEMQRDKVTESVTLAHMHAGGAVDVYLKLPLLESEKVTLEIGGKFQDPRGGYYMLEDTGINNFTVVGGLTAGDVIHIYNNLALSEADKYVVAAINKNALVVSRSTQFPAELPNVLESFDDASLGSTFTGDGKAVGIPTATRVVSSDDVDKYIVIKESNTGNSGVYKITAIDAANNNWVTDVTGSFLDENPVVVGIADRIVEYSVGNNPPYYDNHISRRKNGLFTKTIQNDGRVLLPAKPIYRVKKVSFASDTNPYSVSGRVTFLNRVNREPAYTANPDELEFQLLSDYPNESQSGWQNMLLDVGWASDKDYFNGENLEVEYATLTGYASIWAYMMRTDVRLVCASVIPKGLHPVYITVEVKYKPAKTASLELDTDAAVAAIVAYINGFDPNEDLDTSDIITFFRSEFDEVGYAEQPTVYYDLLSPDGRVIHFKTDDLVSIDPTKVIDPATGLPPASSQTELLLTDPVALGVSDNTVRYLTATDLIKLTKIG